MKKATFERGEETESLKQKSAYSSTNLKGLLINKTAGNVKIEEEEGKPYKEAASTGEKQGLYHKTEKESEQEGPRGSNNIWFKSQRGNRT